MRYKESETIEFKRSTSELKEAVFSISAILNKHGRGEVYFGIKNDGAVVGQVVGSKTLRDCGENCGENCGEDEGEDINFDQGEPRDYPK